MKRRKAILFSIIWTVVILLFPVTSGVFATVLEMNPIQIFMIQGCFMLISLAIPIIYVFRKKISVKELGLKTTSQGSMKKVLFFIPMALAEIPLLLAGVEFNSFYYTSILVLFTLAVGISEEIYFRGIISNLLKNTFSVKQVIFTSSIIFGLGHIVSILAAKT